MKEPCRKHWTSDIINLLQKSTNHKSFKKKKIFNYVAEFFQKNKHSKKFWLFFTFNLFLYLVAFPFGIIISFLWWFFKSSKISKKARKIVVYSFLAFVFSISTYTVWAYSKDPEPTLEIRGIENNQVIQSSNIDLSGVFTPSDFTVYINGEKVDSSGGNFSYSYPLQVGKNKIIVKVSNFKSTQEEITIIRELSPEEIAQQEVEKQRLEEEKKLAEEVKKQADEVSNAEEYIPEDIEQKIVEEPTPTSEPQEKKKGFFASLFSKGEVEFIPETALERVKNYEVETTIAGETSKKTLENHFRILESKSDANKDFNWLINDSLTGNPEGYFVTHNFRNQGNMTNTKWFVTKDRITAIDDDAKALAPELVPEGYDPRDAAITESWDGNLSKEFDSDPSNTSDKFAETSYNNAYQATADEYEITVDEVKEAIERNRKANSII